MRKRGTRPMTRGRTSGKTATTVITVIASLITILVFVTGYRWIGDFFATNHGQRDERPTKEPDVRGSHESSNAGGTSDQGKVIFSCGEIKRDPTLQDEEGPDRHDSFSSPQSTGSQPSTGIHLRRIEGVAFSYSKKDWARPSWGPGYPHVRLQFWRGLIAGGAFSWDAEHSVESDKLHLTVQRLRLPEIVIVPVQEYYKEIGVGYYVELDNAVFADYTLARTIILQKTFLGDNPPERISKTYELIPVADLRHSDPPEIQGEWEGSYETQEDNRSLIVAFNVRLQQSGNSFRGAGLDHLKQDDPQMLRWEVNGWLLSDKVTFVKRHEPNGVGVAYVADLSSDVKQLSGAWYSGLRQGKWNMRWKRELTGSVDDLLGPDSTNPPQRRQ